jgi:hypothetical protein
MSTELDGTPFCVGTVMPTSLFPFTGRFYPNRLATFHPHIHTTDGGVNHAGRKPGRQEQSG